jgi:hypothetical protein
MTRIETKTMVDMVRSIGTKLLAQKEYESFFFKFPLMFSLPDFSLTSKVLGVDEDVGDSLCVIHTQESQINVSSPPSIHKLWKHELFVFSNHSASKKDENTYALTGLLLQVILNLCSLRLEIDLVRLELDTLSGQD